MGQLAGAFGVQRDERKLGHDVDVFKAHFVSISDMDDIQGKVRAVVQRGGGGGVAAIWERSADGQVAAPCGAAACGVAACGLTAARGTGKK